MAFPPDPQAPTGSPDQTGAGAPPSPDGTAQPQNGAAPQAPPRTPEEVEAEWQNRFSQRDRAHNAEVESLRRQVAEATGKAPSPAADGSTPPGDSYKARYEATQRELEQERREKTVAIRRSQYPRLATEIAATDPVWAQANDESLARMNAILNAPAAPPPTGHVDANQPSRAGTGVSKPLDQMTKDELLRELARQSPAEEARMRELTGG